MFPGSTVVSEPNMIKISREECVGKWLMRRGTNPHQYVEMDEKVMRSGPHTTAPHLYGILQARLAGGLEFMSLRDRLEHVLRVPY
jgi:hypothetical protein